MKKVYILILGLFVLIVGLTAQTKPTLDNLYDQQKDAVVMVSSAIYLDSTRIDHVDIIRKFEKGIGFSILDTYLRLGHGSAFFISPDGYAITNEHCVKPLTRDTKSFSALFAFVTIGMRHLAPGYASQRDIRRVSDALLKYAENEPVVLLLSTKDRKDYIAEVISQNQKDDLALLKITLDTKKPVIRIGGTPSLREGQDVYSIGYPDQLYTDYHTEDIQTTLTSGIVSALRSEQWDIQHTAALNYGNSGGPLFRQDGTLVGVNSRMQSNKITTYYYAVGVEKLTAWLTEIGKAHLVEGN
ncbi:MAG TPA: trypsin-like serine protease [Treponema sp.]|nr:trypsin-like serine protease [Treponema sp.]